jgi:hypothetical protein
VSVTRNADGTIELEGDCPVEDAESLLRLLHADPTANIDWTACRRVHTAVLQVIIAAGTTPWGPCGDVWIDQCMYVRNPT